MMIVREEAQEHLKRLLADHTSSMSEADAQVHRESVHAMINRWLERGDGVAFYVNQDLGHHDLGGYQAVSFGGPNAQLEVDEPPTRLPDIGNRINWRFILVGAYRGEALSE